MKCSNCKALVPAGKTICPYCGHFLNDNSQSGLDENTGGKKTILGGLCRKKTAVVLLVIAIIVVAAAMIVVKNSSTIELRRVFCIHAWVDADCTSPKTCNKCGETDGIALAHEWVEATYSSPKTCAICLTTEGEPLINPLTAPIRARLPIVTFSMSSEQRLYGYEDAALTQKIDSDYFIPDTDEIVITDISENGTALKIRYPSFTAQSGYQTHWFPLDDIVSLTEIDVGTKRADEKTVTYRFSQLDNGMVHYGTMESRNQYIVLGKHPSDYTAIIYAIHNKTIYGLTVSEKLAMVEFAP